MLLTAFCAHLLCAHPFPVPSVLARSSALPFAPSPVVQDDEEYEADDFGSLVLRRYGIRSLLEGLPPTEEGEDLEAWTLPVLTEVFFDDFGTDGGGADAAWAVYERVAAAIGGEAYDDGRLFELVDDGMLELRASEAAHERLVAQLDELHAALAADAVLRVERYELDAPVAGLVGGVVPALRAAELAGALAPQARVTAHEVRATAFAGRRVGGGSLGTILRELDVEIAPGAVALDPAYRTIEVGPSAVLRAAPCGDGWHVAAVLADRSVGQSQDAPTVGVFGTDGEGRRTQIGTFDRPAAVRGTCVASTFFLPVGSAAVFVADGTEHGPSVVVVTAVSGDPAIVRRRADGRLAVALDAAVRPRVVARRVDLDGAVAGPRPLESSWSGATVMQVATRAGYVDGTCEVVDGLLERCEGPDEDFEPWVHVERVLGQDPLHGTVDLAPDWSVDGRPVADVLADVVRSMAHPRTNLSIEARLVVDGEVATTWSAPVVPGAEVVLVSGRESLRVVDFGVEVAEHTSVGDPVVEPVVDGTALAITVEPAGAGALSVQVDGGTQSSRFAIDERPRMLVDVVSRTTLRYEDLSGVRRVGAGADGAYRASFGELTGSGVRLDVTVRAQP